MLNPYEVVEYGGIKVGYIGISTPYTPINSTPAFFAEDGKQVYYFGIEKTVSEFYDGIQQTIDDCRNDGADYVVALSHMGIEEECKPYRSSDLIANTTGIDVVLDGHSHTEMTCNVVENKTGEPVLLSQTGTKFSSIGKLMITASGNISVGLISEYEKKDAETEKFVGDVLRKYNGEMNKVIGHMDVSMPIADESGIRMVRSRELAIGDMVADAYRIISGADIGMCNGGGIRASINEGDITYADIINVNPYGNNLCVVKLTGAEIVDMLEYFYRFTRNVYSENGVAVGEYGSFQQVSGLKFVVDTSKEASVETDANDNLISVSEINRISDFNRVMIKRTHFLSLYSSYLLRCPHSQYTKYYSFGRLAYNYSKTK
ncbi:MAG: 5'-nucleotidase C-terminal domain-containing protein [Clostridia bacterium]|nr:5'-nucleotidase C-terminal domain-containing protein [Clostridia bacterium]